MCKNVLRYSEGPNIETPFDRFPVHQSSLNL